MDQESKKVTVLMAVYNGQKYLAEAIESVLNQTLTDFEFLIIDDASTDKTPEILKFFVEKDQRIVIFRNEINIGLTKSLNIGLKKARAKYIARLDADDIALPDRLKTQLDFLESSPRVTLVGSFAEIIDKNGQSLGVRKVVTESEVIKFELILRNCFFHSAVFFRKGVVLTTGGYNESFRHAQDFELFSRLSEKHSLANIARPLIKLRVHGESVVAMSGSQQIVHQNTLKIIRGGISRYTGINSEEFDVFREISLSREIPKRIKFKDLFTALRINRLILENFVDREGTKGAELSKIFGRYRARRGQIIRRFIVSLKRRILE